MEIVIIGIIFAGLGYGFRGLINRELKAVVADLKADIAKIDAKVDVKAAVAAAIADLKKL